MHKPLFRIAVGSVAAVGGLIAASALPAGAATAVRAELMDTCSTGVNAINGTACTPPDTTPVTFSITSTGVLAITAPVSTATIHLGTAAASPTGSHIGTPGDFGTVTVTDNRALNPADWTATVSSTDFTTIATPSDTIPAGDATYTIPPVGSTTLVDGTATPVPGALVATSGLPLPGSGFLTDDASTGIPLANAVVGPPTGTPVITVLGYDGDNGATWNPEIDIAVPDNAVAGTYDGTVTHSVT